MKKIILLLFVLTSASLNAAYSQRGINEYFSDGKVYYRGILENQEERGFLSSKTSHSRCVNLQVFDLDSGKTWKVFDRNLGKNLSITDIVFERPVEDSQRMLFNNGRFENQKISDNAKNRIIIVVYDSQRRSSSLWSADRLGKDLKELTRVSETESWHIDSTNQKIRVFSRHSDSYQMREYPW